MWMEVHMYSVKAKSKAGNIWVKVKDINDSTKFVATDESSVRVTKITSKIGVSIMIWQPTFLFLS